MSKLLSTSNLPGPRKHKHPTKQASKHQSNKGIRWNIWTNRALRNEWLIYKTYRNIPS